MVLKYHTDEQPNRKRRQEGEATGSEQREATGQEQREATTGWFTVEKAIEKVGFGYLQLRIYVICKLIVVRAP